MVMAADRARDFLENERVFRLGALPTEQSHPLTAHLSRVITGDLAGGVRQLLAVDRDIVAVARRVFDGPAYAALVDASSVAPPSGGTTRAVNMEQSEGVGLKVLSACHSILAF